MCIPSARADLIPTLPTVTVPSLPVSVPTVPSLPIGTTVTVTTTVPTLPIGTTTPPTTSTAGGGSGGGGGGGSEPPSGGSVPVSSVTAPARLVISQITVSPRWIGARHQQVRLVVRVVDSRGHRVRGASVDVRSSPARMIGSSGARKTRADGTVSLQVRTTSVVPMRVGAKLTLVVRAYQAGAVLTATNVARRVVSLPIRPR